LVDRHLVVRLQALRQKRPLALVRQTVGMTIKNSRKSRLKYPFRLGCTPCRHFGNIVCGAGNARGYPNIGRKCRLFEQRTKGDGNGE
jgi:hypothetical protein